jgi:hypothetical protein
VCFLEKFILDCTTLTLRKNVINFPQISVMSCSLGSSYTFEIMVGTLLLRLLFCVGTRDYVEGNLVTFFQWAIKIGRKPHVHKEIMKHY